MEEVRRREEEVRMRVRILSNNLANNTKRTRQEKRRKDKTKPRIPNLTRPEG